MSFRDKDRFEAGAGMVMSGRGLGYWRSSGLRASALKGSSSRLSWPSLVRKSSWGLETQRPYKVFAI